ncbi:MAG: nucleoside deaminase [Candidatus Ancillula sp.]|jgi:tRNA(adenine34) deaminase|nr:nucleoside deaminase [Candidatus Ancillula sp.]
MNSQTISKTNEQLMLKCLKLLENWNQTDIPIAALIYNPQTDLIIAGAVNQKEIEIDPTEHAEIIAIRKASKINKSSNLTGLTLITTLEPCQMCAGAILNSKISKVIFGAWDEKFGAAGSVWDLLRDPLSPSHPEVIGGVLAEDSKQILQDFFKKIRKNKINNINISL